MEQLPIGAEIGGYRIIRVAGRGATGVVYVAEHIHLGRVAAVKTLSAAVAGEAEFQERFIRESRSAAAIDHPHIVPIYDAGEEDGVLFLVMRYVDGSDVAQLLEAQGGPLDVDLTLSLGGQIAGALDAANGKGLIHRDVKPANILLEHHSGRMPHSYLTDFGLTKHGQASTLTRAGQFVGTLLYMAPEQIEGHPVSGSSDLYSLACVLWECLVGLPPFLPKGGSNLSLLSAHTLEPVPRITERRPGLPAALDQVFLTALAKAPEARHASAAAFVAAVHDALEGYVRPASLRPALTPAGPDSDTARVPLGPSGPRPATLPGSGATPPPTSTPGSGATPPPTSTPGSGATPPPTSTPGSGREQSPASPVPAAVTGPLGPMGPPGAPADDEDGQTLKIRGSQLAEAQQVISTRASPGESPQPAPPTPPPRPGAADTASPPDAPPAPASPATPVRDDRMPTARFDAPSLGELPPTGQSRAAPVAPFAGRSPGTPVGGPEGAGPTTPGVLPSGSTAGAGPANPWAAAPASRPPGLPAGAEQGGPGRRLPGAAGPGGLPPGAPVQRSQRRGRWLWILLAVLVLAAVLLAVVIVTGREGADVGLVGATAAAGTPTAAGQASAEAGASDTTGDGAPSAAAAATTLEQATGVVEPAADATTPAPAEPAAPTEPPATETVAVPGQVIGGTGVTEEALAGQDALDQGPIAFVSQRDGNSEIYVVEADGSGLRRLTDDPADDAQPAWSPDGTQLAFSSDRGGSRAVWTMAPDGSAASRVSAGPDDSDPAWSPEGTQIVFSRGLPTGRELVVVTLADGSERTLGVTAAFPGATANALRPAWAPGGSPIAYQVDGSGDFDVWTVQPDGADARRALGLPGADDFHPAWAPDGSGILFTSDRDGTQDLWVAGPDGSQENRLALSTADRDERDGDFSTGGGHLAFVLATGATADLAVVRSVGTDPSSVIPATTGDSDPSWLR